MLLFGWVVESVGFGSTLHAVRPSLGRNFFGSRGAFFFLFFFWPFLQVLVRAVVVLCVEDMVRGSSVPVRC